MIKLFLTYFLIFCTIFYAEDKWRKVECIPAEIPEKHVELSPDAKAEAKALADYAMSLYRPVDFSERPENEKIEYIEECAQKILRILELYPESETALKSLMKIRVAPQFKEKALQELSDLRKKVPNSNNVQAAYLSTLLIAGKLDEAYQELPTLLEKFPKDPLIIMQATTIYSERNDYANLEKTFALMDEIPELQKDPAMRILYLGYLNALGEQESTLEYYNTLAYDDEFIAKAVPVYDLLWQQLAKTDSWNQLTGLSGAIFLHNFWNVNDSVRCALCWKTFLAAIRCNDQDVIAFILKFIADLEDRGIRFRLVSQTADVVNQYTSKLAEEHPEEVDGNLILLNQTLGEMCLANLPNGAPPDTACRILIKYHLWGGNPPRALELARMIQKPTQEDDFRMTDLLIMQEQFEEALPRLHKIADELQDNLTADFYMQLGLTEDKCGNLEESIKAFYKALELNPKFAAAANYLGYTLLIHDRNLAEAERLLEIAYNESKNNPAIMDSMAWLRFKQGRNAEALRIMADVVRIIGSPRLSEDENTELREHLQAILLSLGYDYLASYYN